MKIFAALAALWACIISIGYAQDPRHKQYAKELYGKKKPVAKKQTVKPRQIEPVAFTIDAEALGGKKEDLLKKAQELSRSASTSHIHTAAYVREHSRFKDLCKAHSFSDEETSTILSVPPPSSQAHTRYLEEEKAAQDVANQKLQAIDKERDVRRQQVLQEAAIEESRLQAEAEAKDRERALQVEERKAAAMEAQAEAIRYQNITIKPQR